MSETTGAPTTTEPVLEAMAEERFRIIEGLVGGNERDLHAEARRVLRAALKEAGVDFAVTEDHEDEKALQRLLKAAGMDP